MSLTPVNSFPAVSLTQAKIFRLFGYLWPVSPTPGKYFITGVVVTGDNCSPVTLIPAKNLSPVLLSPAIIVHRCRWYRRKIYHRCHCHQRYTGDKFIAVSLPIKKNPWRRLIAGVNDTADKSVSSVVDTAEQFIASVVDTADKHSFVITSANFQKKLK